MMGFSNSGMFAHRFTMIHPERVKAVWLGGEAAAPLPAEELYGTPLDYPLGMRNIEDLAGKTFDFETYIKIPHFVIVGENDTVSINDTANPEIFKDEGALFIREYFGPTNPERIKFFYEFLVSVGVPAEFKMYEGIGHELPDYLFEDAFDFFIMH